MRAILVRVEVPASANLGDKCLRTVEEIEIGETIDAIYDVVKCSTFAMVDINDDHSVYLDDQGLCNDHDTGFIALTETTWHPHQPLAGNFLIKGLRSSDGNSIGATITIDEVKKALGRSVVADLGALSIPAIKPCAYCGGGCLGPCNTLNHLSLTGASKNTAADQQ